MLRNMSLFFSEKRNACSLQQLNQKVFLFEFLVTRLFAFKHFTVSGRNFKKTA